MTETDKPNLRVVKDENYGAVEHLPVEAVRQIETLCDMALVSGAKAIKISFATPTSSGCTQVDEFVLRRMAQMAMRIVTEADKA